MESACGCYVRPDVSIYRTAEKGLSQLDRTREKVRRYKFFAEAFVGTDSSWLPFLWPQQQSTGENSCVCPDPKTTLVGGIYLCYE
jgi:hypothetical protein